MRDRPGAVPVLLAVVAMLAAATPPAAAGEVTVAVASSFAPTLDDVARAFEAASGHRVVASPGATGALYARIVNGAPYDVYLAADAERPARLAAAGLAEPPFTYAVGRLALWSRDADAADGPGSLRRPGRVAIANPTTAPYGAASLQALRALGLESELAGRLVRGQNVAQAYQFAASGAARLAFVAVGQLPPDGPGSMWLVPPEMHDPLRHDGVVLRRAADRDAAAAFAAFLADERGRRIVRRHGYAEP